MSEDREDTGKQRDAFAVDLGELVAQKRTSACAIVKRTVDLDILLSSQGL